MFHIPFEIPTPHVFFTVIGNERCWIGQVRSPADTMFTPKKQVDLTGNVSVPVKPKPPVFTVVKDK